MTNTPLMEHFREVGNTLHQTFHKFIQLEDTDSLARLILPLARWCKEIFIHLQQVESMQQVPRVSKCAPGFDCALENSCPSVLLDCPKGFFCGSYQLLERQGLLDLRYAQLKSIFVDITVTEQNKEKYIDPDRVIQTPCLSGFFCPNATSMHICPANHWCPERTMVPNKCDALSICAEGSTFQVNFVNALIMVLVCGFALVCGAVLRSRQRKMEDASRQKDPSVRHAKVHTEHVVKPGVLNMSFKDIYFRTSNNRVILPNIHGKIPAGKISAILGPTACGKSTLLNTLRSGGNNGTTGEIKVSIRDYEARKEMLIDNDSLQRYVGYVPQEDILDRSLTVRELLTFNALSRIREYDSKDDLAAIVDQVLSDLSIQHIADTIIGGGENQAANISGGQLKRVNIACELVALTKPSVLLLDEPTAGLDALIAFELMETLQSVRDKGITIVIVLQQPRAEIFEKIQNLFLMNICGGIVYEGASSGAVPYLQSLGYEPSPETSDADFCLDVLNGLLDHTNEAQHPESVNVVNSRSLHLLWREPDQPSDKLDLVGVASPPGEEPLSSSRYSTKQYSTGINGVYLSLFLIFLNAKRLILIRLRDFNQMIIYIMINTIMAVSLSSGFTIYLNLSYLGAMSPPVDDALQPFAPSPVSAYSDRNSSSIAFAQLLFFMSSALGCASCLTTVPVFAGVLPLAKREHTSGIHVVWFAIGRILADLFFVVVYAFVFAGIWCLFGHAGSFYNWIATIVCTAFAASGVGYITGAASRKNSASVFAIIITFVFCVFAGVEPTLAQVERYPVVFWPWYLSFATWTAEATYFTWTEYLTNDGNVPAPVQEGADVFGYDISHGIGRAVGALIALGVGMRLISIYILWRKAAV